jgi:hypothetical protein
MEAATPLRKAHVRSIGDRLAIDGLVLDDECAVRLVREREEAGEDPVRLVADAVGIGARVLDREQAGANAEFVRSEFDKVSREVEESFTKQAGAAGEQLQRQLDEVFAPEGFLARSLERHFSDDSSGAVQHRVKQVVEDVTRQAQQELLKQFFSADSANPLAEFKAGVIRAVHQAGQRQDTGLRNLDQRMAGLQEQLAALKAERDKLAELEAERERGTAKGRTFEELVHDEIDRVAAAQGDDCDAVGDVKGAGGRVGDVVVGIDACSGPARGRIVFEAKNSKLSKNKAFQELDEALQQRDADFAVLVVPSEDKVPAKMRQLREYNGDKLIVTFDPEAEGAITLEVAYSLARARVLMSQSESEGIDASAVRDTVERALNAMETVRAVKNQLTGAKTGIDRARDLIDTMADQVREHLRMVDRLVLEASADGEHDDRVPAARPDAVQETLV